MPNYEYVCTQCGKVTEFELSIKEKEKTRLICPNCGMGSMKQIYRPKPFIMKGDND